MRDGRYSEASVVAAEKFTRKMFERELVPPLGRWYPSLECAW
jgi:hypothetical protein